MNLTFDINFQTLEEFIYKKRSSPSTKINFGQLSKLAHTSHNAITRRYRKFMNFKRGEGKINKAKANHCCNMVKSHLNDLKEVQIYLYQNDLVKEHPVFYNKITKWIEQCEKIHDRYKKHIKEL